MERSLKQNLIYNIPTSNTEGAVIRAFIANHWQMWKSLRYVTWTVLPTLTLLRTSLIKSQIINKYLAKSLLKFQEALNVTFNYTYTILYYTELILYIFLQMESTIKYQKMYLINKHTIRLQLFWSKRIKVLIFKRASSRYFKLILSNWA